MTLGLHRLLVVSVLSTLIGFLSNGYCAPVLYYLSDLEGDSRFLKNISDPNRPEDHILNMSWEPDGGKGKKLLLEAVPGAEFQLVLNGDLIGGFHNGNFNASAHLVEAFVNLAENLDSARLNGTNKSRVHITMGNKDVYLLGLFKFLIEDETLKRYRNALVKYGSSSQEYLKQLEYVSLKIDHWCEMTGMGKEISEIIKGIGHRYGIEGGRNDLVKKFIWWIASSDSPYFKLLKRSKILLALKIGKTHFFPVHGGYTQDNIHFIPSYYDHKKKRVINPNINKFSGLDTDRLDVFLENQFRSIEKAFESFDWKDAMHIILDIFGDSNFDRRIGANFSNKRSSIYPNRPADKYGNTTLPDRNTLNLIRAYMKKRYGIKKNWPVIFLHGHSPSYGHLIFDPRTNMTFAYLDVNYQNIEDKSKYFVKITESEISHYFPREKPGDGRISIKKIDDNPIPTRPETWVGLVYKDSKDGLFYIQQAEKRGDKVIIRGYRKTDGYRNQILDIELPASEIEKIFRYKIKVNKFLGSHEADFSTSQIQKFLNEHYPARGRDNFDDLMKKNPELKKMTPIYVTGSSKWSASNIANVNQVKNYVSKLLDQCGTPPSCYLVGDGSIGGMDEIVFQEARLRGIPTIALYVDEVSPQDFMQVDYYVHVGKDWTGLTHLNDALRLKFSPEKNRPSLLSFAYA